MEMTLCRLERVESHFPRVRTRRVLPAAPTIFVRHQAEVLQGGDLQNAETILHKPILAPLPVLVISSHIPVRQTARALVQAWEKLLCSFPGKDLNRPLDGVEAFAIVEEH